MLCIFFHICLKSHLKQAGREASSYKIKGEKKKKKILTASGNFQWSIKKSWKKKIQLRG